MGYKLVVLPSADLNPSDEKMGSYLNRIYPKHYPASQQTVNRKMATYRYWWRYSFPHKISIFEEPDFTVTSNFGGVYPQCWNRYAIRALYKKDDRKTIPNVEDWSHYMVEVRCPLARGCWPCRIPCLSGRLHSQKVLYDEPYGFCKMNKLFVKKGVQNTSTAAIAKEAGSAAGTLFLYFPTKQDLIDELIFKISREQSEYIKAKLDLDLPARESFFTIWDGSVRWFLENMDAYLYVQQVRDSGIISEAAVQEPKLLASFAT